MFYVKSGFLISFFRFSFSNSVLDFRFFIFRFSFSFNFKSYFQERLLPASLLCRRLTPRFQHVLYQIRFSYFKSGFLSVYWFDTFNFKSGFLMLFFALCRRLTPRRKLPRLRQLGAKPFDLASQLISS